MTQLPLDREDVAVTSGCPPVCASTCTTPNPPKSATSLRSESSSAIIFVSSSARDGDNESERVDSSNTANDGSDTSDADANGANKNDEEDEKRRQLIYALHSLRLYNPNFDLTPEVLEIMRAFFDDLEPDANGTISLRALFAEIQRLDPEKQFVTLETRQRMKQDFDSHHRKRQNTEERHAVADDNDDSAGEDDERIDFQMFCSWVMRWKELSPSSIENVYTSWAKQIVAMDFGLNEGGDGVFVLQPEEVPPPPNNAARAVDITNLLRSRKMPASSQIQRSQEANNIRNGGLSLFSSPRHIVPPETPAMDVYDEQTGIISAGGDDGSRREKHGPEHKTGSPPSTTSAELRREAKKESMITMSKSFIAGGCAGIMAKSLLAPVDRIKILFQVNENRTFSVRNGYKLAREIYIQDGFRALFRGNMLNILRVVPYAGVQHSSFDFFRRKFHSYNARHADMHNSSGHDHKHLSNVQLVTAGSLAGGLSLVVAYPLDIVRARYMVQQGKYKYKSLYEAVVTMYKVEGARSFGRGLVPSLLGTLPYTGIGFSLNEIFKRWMLEVQPEGMEKTVHVSGLHPFSKFVCSYFAACIAQTTTYPMDTIRRRIQTDGYVTGGHQEPRYTGVITTARIIMAQEGWRGFFKGVSVNWMRSPLATGISLTTYDILKEVMGVERIA